MAMAGQRRHVPGIDRQHLQAVLDDLVPLLLVEGLFHGAAGPPLLELGQRARSSCCCCISSADSRCMPERSRIARVARDALGQQFGHIVEVVRGRRPSPPSCWQSRRSSPTAFASDRAAARGRVWGSSVAIKPILDTQFVSTTGLLAGLLGRGG